MNVDGITSGYWHGYETQKTKGAESGNRFENAVHDAVEENESAILHGSDEDDGDIAVAAWASIIDSSSMTVYKGADFDPGNPIYKVKMWDKDGNVTERMVDLSNVDTENCDTMELFAYTAHLKESGKGSFENTVLKAAIAKAAKNAEQKNAGSWDFSQKVDWVETVRDIMQSVYNYGDYKGYLGWKNFLDFLMKKSTSNYIV